MATIRAVQRLRQGLAASESDEKAPWWSLRRYEDTWIGSILGADLRSLAIFRISLALIILSDLLSRFPSIRLLYTNEGVMPRDHVVDGGIPWRWSLNFINDTYEFQAAVFLVAIAASIALALGYRTRLMTVALWVLVCSIQARNPLVLSGADTLLRVVLFWSMFLPLGAKWSLDHRFQRPAVNLNARTLSVATIGFFFQIAFMYWFTAILKDSPEWRTDGTALFYAMSAKHVTKGMSDVMLQFPTLMRILTHGTLILEFLAPVLMLVPFRNGPMRTIGCASIISLHIGIFLTLDVGIFPWLSSACMLAFLPAWFWDTVVVRVRAGFSMTSERYAGLRRALVEPAHEALSAFTHRLSGVPMFTSVGGRGLVSTIDEPRLKSGTGATVPAGNDNDDRGSARRVRSLPLANAFLSFCLVFIFLWNLTSVTSFALPNEARPFAYASGLYQKWNMFAPRPSTGITWIVVRGVLEDGQAIDLLTPIVNDDLTQVSSVSWAQPADIPGEYYGDKHWRKYLTALGFKHTKEDRRRFAAYSCRTWNAHYEGDARLEKVQIFRMTRPTSLSGEETKIHRTHLAQYTCV